MIPSPSRVLGLALFLMLSRAAPVLADQEVRVGVYNNPPIVSYGADGHAGGLAVDVLKDIARREGWRLTYVHDTWPRLLDYLDRGDIDLLAGIAYSPSRDRRYRFTRETLMSNWGVVLRAARARITSFTDLDGKRIALLSGDIYKTALEDLARGFDISYEGISAESYAQIVELVRNGKADAGVVNRLYALSHRPADEVLPTTILFHPVEIRYAEPRRQSPALVARIDHHLSDLKADRSSSYYQALAHYLNSATDHALATRLKWVLGGALVLLLWVGGFAFLLHLRVKQRTTTLEVQADDLAREIQQRRQSEERLRHIVEASPDVIYALDREGHYLKVSSSQEQLLLEQPEHLPGRGVEDVMPSPVGQGFLRQIERTLSTGAVQSYRYHLSLPDGRHDYESRFAPLACRNGQPPAVMVIARDISEQKRAEDQLRLAATVFEKSREGIMVTDSAQRIVSVNPAFCEITGYARTEVLGRTPNLLQSGRHDRTFYQGLWGALLEQGYWRGEIWNRRKDGEVYPEWLTINVVRNQAGAMTHYVAVFTDLSTIKRSREQLEYLTHYQPLTGLPNRLLFKARLEHSLQRAARKDGLIAVLYLDLDGFKHINESLGHPAGDRVLQQVGERLAERVRREDTLAHLGGDEFAIALEWAEQAEEVARFSEELLQALSQPFTVQGHEVYALASIGISLYPRDGLEVDALLRNADAAMYRAKGSRHTRYQFYTRELTEEAVQRVRLNGDLRRALAGNELELYYQPQVRLSDAVWVGAEALIRWHHPQLGLMMPNLFISLAEESDLIDSIGLWVLRTACVQIKTWEQQGLRLDCVSVNLSGKQVHDPALVDKVQGILEETALPGHRLQLEITESYLMDQSQRSLDMLDRLRRLGVRLSIDDFGTGYSSLSYLKRFAVHELKIDRSFVKHLPEDTEDAVISRAVIGLGHNLRMRVIAEGVETPGQQAFLSKEGCDLGQGYLYGHPMPARDFQDRYEEKRPSPRAVPGP